MISMRWKVFTAAASPSVDSTQRAVTLGRLGERLAFARRQGNGLAFSTQQRRKPAVKLTRPKSNGALLTPRELP